MRAAVIPGRGEIPQVEDFREPEVAADCQLITVVAGTIGPTDLMRAEGLFGPVEGPYVVGGEGIGRFADGSRVYFGHSTPPFGSWAERTAVPAEEAWPIPDDIDDEQALALGISGTGALIPLEEANMKSAEQVLILGATGALGQIALQVARILGAGRVIGAARNLEALQHVHSKGLADDIVQIGTDDDTAALKNAAHGDGFDVVLDVVYGPPAEAAMKATAPGARMMSIGVQAGATMTLSLRDLVFRSHIGIGTGQRPVQERRAAYQRLLGMARENGLAVDTVRFPLDRAADAWTAQAASPHGKVIVRP